MNTTVIANEDTTTAAAHTARIVCGRGAELWDESGHRYLDCIGGQGSANLGHCHPRVVQAIQAQAERLITCPMMLENDTRDELLRQLQLITPPGLDRFFLCNSGTEAIEAAIKAARLTSGRTGIIAARRGFHGRTMGALSVTWEQAYRAPFEPLIPGVRFVPYNDIDALRSALDETIGLVLLEPVQGEGGVHPAAPGYLQAVAALCRTHGVLLALDEIQTGFGRTGTMFACEQDGVVPDLLCLAKSMAGGVSMGALAFGPCVEAFPPGAHGSTFGGNPLACAAAVAAIGALVDERLPQRAAEAGAYLMAQLQQLNAPAIRSVRGRGLLIGLELRGRARPIVTAMRAQGVLALTAGLGVLRLLPPLVITQEQCDEVVAVIDGVLRAAGRDESAENE